MGFNAIYALWLLPFLGLIVLMYLLKEEHEELEIPSLYLWKTVMADSEVKKPWQKLKKNILMILQLLAAFLIIITLAGPFLKTQKALGGNIIIVIDNSGSMNAQMEGKSRLDMAKVMAESIVKEASRDSSFTVITSAKDAKVEGSNIKDKNETINKIKKIKAGNMEGNLNNQYSLIKAIYNQYPDAEVFAYTDEPFSLDGMKGEVTNLGGNGENLAITNISYKEENDDYTVLVRISNTGNATGEREIALYGDDNLIELKDIEITAGSTVSVYFYGVEKEYDYLTAELSKGDALKEDDKAFLITENPEPKKVLMVSKGNTFLEKAITAIEGLELYKSDNIDTSEDDFDLYIFDGETPNAVPESGSILFINPKQNNAFLDVTDELNGMEAYFEANPINKHTKNQSFFINKAKIIKKPIWAETLIVTDDNVLSGIGKWEGRKTAYISFDIRESELPLTPSFPIFIYNIVSELADLESKGMGFYQSGETIDLALAPDIKEAEITLPSGKTELLKENILSYGFGNTEETGIYRADYLKGEKAYQKFYAVNFPPEESKNSFSDWLASKNENREIKKYNASLNMEKPLIIIIVLLLFTEWAVYNRGI
jgi:hypothetical protein